MHNVPRTPPVWRRYLRFWRSDPVADVDAELEFHVDSRIEELVQQGSSEPDARRAALREFGDYASVRREVQMLEQSLERRRAITERLWDLARDTRYALRSLGRSPGLTIVIVLTLSLGIGLNSTMFSLVNAYLFRPVNVPGAERLIVMGNTSPLLQQPHEVPYRDLQAYRELRNVFENLTGTVSYTESFDKGDRTERIWVEHTLGNYFTTLRPPMALGRVYTDESSARSEHVVVVSYDFWSRRLGGDSSVIGRPLRISGRPRTVIGVTARGFHGFAPLLRSDGWSPIDESPAARAQFMADADGDWFNTYGILRQGVSIAQARAAVRERARQLQQQYPSTNKGVEPVIVPETRARPVITVASPIPLMAVVVLSLTLMVLVVACANVASLLLARGTTKHREHAVRAALGASRWRLTRQAMLETAILSLAGALGAAGLARWSTTALAHIRLATDAPLNFDLAPDWRVFAFTLVTALATTLLAGLAPALRNASADPQTALVAGGRSATDRAQQRLRSIIVVGQIAVSAIVVIAAGLFARSMQAAQKMDLGFRTDRLLMAQFDLSLSGYDTTRARAFERELLIRVRALPGVERAALASRVPLGYNNNAQRILTESLQRDNPGGALVFENSVSPQYFATAGPSILRGREFAESDDATSPHVAVVNEVMARELWPNEDPIGKVIRLPGEKEELRVVGIARNATYMMLSESPRKFFWTARAQHRNMSPFLEVVTSGSPEALVPAVRRVVRDLDPNVPLFEVRSMTDHLRNGRAMFAIRLGAMFGGSFALLALALAMVGLYGLVSYSVSHRTREIGIRIAVGATVSDVIGLVVRQGLTLALVGVGLGVVAAFAVTRLMASLLYAVDSRDPLTFVLGPLVLGIVSVAASLLPAWKAAAMDPVRALRLD